MIGRPESGSLAARSEIKSKLAFFRKKVEAQTKEESGFRSPHVSLADPQVTKTNGLRLSTASSSSTNGTEESQAGWILKHALDLHFLKERPFLEDTPPFDPPLAEYIKEVFIQLDYHKTGTVSREDFDILCRFLDITSSPPQSYRNSGIEWLSSYRTHSPVSPLKADKISDVKYHRSTEGGESEGTSSLRTRPSSIQNPNFLFTFGPRPFWELWPQKKRRKKRLNFEEFTRSLLEQWAKSKGISLSKVNHCFPPIVVPPRRRKGTYRTKYYRLLPEDSTPPSEPKHVVILQRPSSFDDTRTKRFVRNANRISRRCHFLKRLSRRLDCLKSAHQREAQRLASSKGSHFNPLLPRPSQVEALEKQVIQQKGEIKSLREAIHEMRSSLHLSDAQNLALQVLLRKMKDISSGVGGGGGVLGAPSGMIDIPSASPSSSSEVKPSFASRSVAESEKQLENLVHELREMSQTKYPSVGSSSAHQASYSSNNSTLYNTKLDDSPFEEEIAATSAALGGAKDDLILTQKELQQTVLKLQLKEIELEENSMNLTDAYKALELAQEELNKLRYDLEEAQTALETTKQELSETNDDLAHTKRTLNRTDSTLKETEKRLSQLSQNSK
uniref:EF-hand domain-containing protein n=1 Tax=Lepeophtheirus salmonis TaxID=72036 RepID=A0A0K2UR14_LEPSM